LGGTRSQFLHGQAQPVLGPALLVQHHDDRDGQHEQQDGTDALGPPPAAAGGTRGVCRESLGVHDDPLY
jgi:hypothetical protein